MHCLVTGAAGFIGSHLCEALLAEGHQVLGIDAFTDNYEPALKRANLALYAQHPNFSFLEGNLLDLDLAQAAGKVDWIFHLAARPGVRTSWGEDFKIYCEHNILATQRLLEACLKLKPKKVVFASSSSIYGDARRLPVKETSPQKPISPYGATKLMGEQLCRIYKTNYKVPVCALRYFTVYGPRQRTDMAFSLWIAALLSGRPLPIFGDGQQIRDFTFVSDAVAATMAAAKLGKPGEAYNIAGGSQVSVKEVVALLEQITGRSAQVSWEKKPKGDARHTWADITLAKTRLDYAPKVELRQGLTEQVEAARKVSGD
jgi:nucleoside-diphosphate-sugar epimerase